VLGSNIFNVFAVLGISGLIAPLAVEREVVRFDVPVMIAASLGCWLALADDVLTPWECALFLAGMGAYMVILVRRSLQGPGALPEMVLETAPPPRGAGSWPWRGQWPPGASPCSGRGAGYLRGARRAWRRAWASPRRSSAPRWPPRHLPARAGDLGLAAFRRRDWPWQRGRQQPVNILVELPRGLVPPAAPPAASTRRPSTYR
jgi:hypothetical protein